MTSVSILEAPKGEHLMAFATRLTDLACTTAQVELGTFNGITIVAFPHDEPADVLDRWLHCDKARQIVITYTTLFRSDVDAG
jgi:hypothetical protein